MADIPQQKIASLEKKVGSGGKSPLFAQLASFYIQQGKLNEALRLCDEGLAVFPHYTTGHFIKGKALLALQMNAEARREFQIVQDFLPANRTVSFILSNIEPGDGETLTAPPTEPVAFQHSTETQPPTIGVSAPVVEETISTVETTAVGMEEPVALPIEQAQQENSFEEVVTTSTTDDPFGFSSGTPDVAAKSDSESAIAESEPNPFEGFPTEPEPQVAQEGFPSAETTPASSIFDFGADSQEGINTSPGDESFEVYAARKHTELGGGENTLSLDEYLNPSPEPSSENQPPSAAGNPIEDLAGKLQSAKKITPVINFASKATTPASEADTPASTGFVTPTLAEIYAKQGWYDDAIKAYRTLCVNKPAERERFEQRITELEQMKKQQG